MATYIVRQVLPQSLDTAGISITTATTDIGNPRQGQLYDPTVLAAAAPVWFHPMPGGRYLGLFSRRLHTATVADPQTGGPLVYSSATETRTPSWAVFDPATGSPSVVEPIPTHVVGERTLTSAASRGNYLFTLSTIGDEALLQHFRVGAGGQALTLEAEEVIPGGLGLGLHLERNDLWVFGPRDGRLALARKNWGRVGENKSVNPFLRWRYHTARGWSFDLDDLEPLAGDIPTSGPVSVARRGMRYYLTMPVWTPPVPAVPATPTRPAVPAVPGHWDARTWTSRAIDRRWTPHPFTVPLGGHDTYLGGGVHLQPQLTLTPGYTSTETRNGETVLDAGSDFTQVFTGVASQVVVLPPEATVLTPAVPATPGAPAAPATYRAYTIYNKTPVSDLTVVTADGGRVAVIRHGKELTLTPTDPAPVGAGHWRGSAPPSANPDHRSGFPYVCTVRYRDGANSTLLTAWGVLEV